MYYVYEYIIGTNVGTILYQTHICIIRNIYLEVRTSKNVD